MSRPLRIQYSGAWYHVMNRGRRRENVFQDEEDYQLFIKILIESSSMWNINISAFCLMPNHYHLLIQTPEGNLSRAMRHINGVYTQRFNRKHSHDGQIFRGRYKSILVDADNYLLELVRYIHRNPVRAGIVKNIEDHPWSGHEAYSSSSSKWQWIYKETVFSLLSRDKKKVYGEYKKFVRKEDTNELTDFYKKKNLPSIIGSKEFTTWVKEKFSELVFKEEMPEAKKLAPDVDMINRAVCEVYQIDSASLIGLHRGKENEPRNVAIFLTRHLRRDTLAEVGEPFGIANYSSVSSIVEKVKMKIDRSRKFKKQIEEVKKRIHLRQK